MSRAAARRGALLAATKSNPSFFWERFIHAERGCRRKITMRDKFFCLFFVLSVTLIGAGTGKAAEDERAALEELHQTLQQRVTTLEREQDLLLFQKEMSTSDSKYLVLNLAKKTGQLKYKNRLLKSFHFITEKKYSADVLRSGMLSLTKKVEGNDNRRALIFGMSLMIEWKRVVLTKQEKPIATISVAEQDLLSLYAAMQEGAKAYIVQ